MAGTIVADTIQNGAGTSTSMDNAIYGSAKAWVTLTTPTNGGTTTIAASYNVSSLTKTSAGIFFVNFTNALTDANYSVTGGVAEAIGNTNAPLLQLFSTGLTSNYTAPTTSGFYFITMHSANLSIQDCYRTCLTVLR